MAEDEVGNFWLLAYSPTVGLVKYDRQAERLTTYPIGAGAVGRLIASCSMIGKTDFGCHRVWASITLTGAQNFSRGFFNTMKATRDSLNDNDVISVYRDRGACCGWEPRREGLNILDYQQKQFGRYMHRAGDPNSLSPGRVTAIYWDSEGVLWVGFSPRALDRLDRKTGQVTHYVVGLEDMNSIEKGSDVNSIYKDARGYLWLGGWGSGLDRFDERTGRFKHYRHNPDDPNSLPTNHVLRIYGDQKGQLWVGHIDGVLVWIQRLSSSLSIVPIRKNPTKYGNAALAFYQDRSGTLWVATGEGALIRFDDKTGPL